MREALADRLDLMNERARVVDAWRQIGVAANALKGDVNVLFNADIGTRPGGSNPFDFRASASKYSVGVHLDAPLDRQVERNIYRASLVNYEQLRRGFMALEDNIAQTIRRDVRQLQTERLNFEISRQSLITAARAVEAAQDRLLLVENGTDTTVTQNVLTSLNNLLDSKERLINSWVNYETGRIQLSLDMEALQVDAQGRYRDEPRDPPDQPAASASAGDPRPQPVVP
jgi:outer membrane protein TolC